MRWVRGIGALLTMLVVLLGAPVLLARWGRLGVTDWWARADDGSLLLAVLTIAGWLAWAVFVLAVVLELARLLSGHRYQVELPLLGGLQAICATLILAVLALAAGSGVPHQVSGGEPERAAVDSSTTSRTAPDRTAPDRAASRVEAPSVAAPAARVPSSGPAGPTPVVPETSGRAGNDYLVAPGDDLWSLADRLLGDGTRWRDLVAVNPDILSDPTQALTPGSRLRLPASALAQVEPEPPQPADARPERITVVKGDTLSELAEEHLGRASRWPELARANAALISNPDHIEVGWELVLPARARATVHREHAARPQDAPEPASEIQVAPGPTAQSGVDREPAARADIDPEPAGSSGPDTGGTAGVVPSPESADSAPADQADPGSPDVALVGSMGILAAAGLVGGWEARRLLQNRTRAPGRRVLHPDPELARFQAALGRRGDRDRSAALTAALRAVGRYCREQELPLPVLAELVMTGDWLEFRWAEPAAKPPLGFAGDIHHWHLDFGEDEMPAGEDGPCPFPALVSLGTDDTGATVMMDVERVRVLGVAAQTRELQLAGLASMTVELACAPWAAEVALTVVGTDAGFAAAAGGDAVTRLPDVTTGLAALRRRQAARSRALAGQELYRLRIDPDRTDSVTPEVFVFHAPLEPEAQAELDQLLGAQPAGIAAIVAAPSESPATWELFGDPLQPSGRFTDGREFLAHAIPGATRDAVESLYRIADSDQTEPAPWWADASSNVHPLHPRDTPNEDPVEIVQLRRVVRPHPVLLLLGPIDLTGAAGPEPARSRGQLIEMGSWIMEYPGRTATQMAAGLGIAESTRRSNMSRLRGWLGSDSDGEPYLPDAYSGRIRLHPEVGSDVQQLRLLTGPGVNRLAESTLLAALDLVRGGILADAAPGQWFWAEELRSDLTATLRDTGLVLVDHALNRGDLDLARWAAERALVVTPEDELLCCARIRTEHAAGNRALVQRLVARLSQQARELGVDLLPETVMLCQQVIEGRGRLRRA
ncbi:MAG: LysM peptidoglycan-binding domain-containing protein [Propionicimonas sp.]|uniref:LysM peptidoglycan-binding domain-containing protein n=1 Tax=Propionicimonas sp. TaxID=1955623 RepID=UPI002B2204DF|nr:LysM peptidoglycan-binding domain-containing protein [Propionicimonas sp.]MEA4944476.1 LysM peptidoglycan-binding domain-containing protein [Propionicimonas sp.]